jgi:hypothetical protein
MHRTPEDLDRRQTARFALLMGTLSAGMAALALLILPPMLGPARSPCGSRAPEAPSGTARHVLQLLDPMLGLPGLTDGLSAP